MTQRYSHFSKEYIRHIVDNMGATFSQLLGCDSVNLVKNQEFSNSDEKLDLHNYLQLQEI